MDRYVVSAANLEYLKAINVKYSNTEFFIWFLDGFIYGLEKTDRVRAEEKYKTQTDSSPVMQVSQVDKQCKLFHVFLSRVYLNQIVKESCIEGFGQSISCVGGLFLVQGHIDGLGLPSPL